MNTHKEIRGCACGRRHACGVEMVEIAKGALEMVPGLLRGYDEALLVYDANTYEACGRRLEELLSPHMALQSVLYAQTDVLVPDEESTRRLALAVQSGTQVVVGVGAGVINDLCKYVSHRHALPYMIVATAPSMDGYASTGAALIAKDMKVTYDAHAPRWIVADLDVLCHAPMEMIRAGVGDILGKISCLNDWKLSHLVNGEYLCPVVYGLMERQVRQCIEDIDLIVRRDEESIRRLMENLVMAGVGMSYIGNSRPASGSEHHLAHFYEVMGLLRGFDYYSHGVDVAFGTMVTCGLRHLLAAANPACFANRHDRWQWKQDIGREFGGVAPEVLALQEQAGFYRENGRLGVIRNRWDEISALLRSVPTEKEMIALLARAGLHAEDFWAAYTADVVEESVVYAKDLKDRYTLLWLLQDTGTLECLAHRYTAGYAGAQLAAAAGGGKP